MRYPGHIVQVGEPDLKIVAAIVAQLAARGFKSDKLGAAFDDALVALSRGVRWSRTAGWGR